MPGVIVAVAAHAAGLVRDARVDGRLLQDEGRDVGRSLVENLPRERRRIQGNFNAGESPREMFQNVHLLILGGF